MSRGEGLVYRATEKHPEIFPKWKPSIFMPRWASRITLEIEDVRVERLQEITEEDAKAEGIFAYGYEAGLCGEGSIIELPTYIEPFMELWDSLNAKRGYGWAENPWVWVISFRRIEYGRA